MELQARADELRNRIAGHKAAIRQHRKALAGCAAELAALERECTSRGIRLVMKKGEGEDPWPNRSLTSRP